LKHGITLSEDEDDKNYKNSKDSKNSKDAEDGIKHIKHKRIKIGLVEVVYEWAKKTVMNNYFLPHKYPN